MYAQSAVHATTSKMIQRAIGRFRFANWRLASFGPIGLVDCSKRAANPALGNSSTDGKVAIGPRQRGLTLNWETARPHDPRAGGIFWIHFQRNRRLPKPRFFPTTAHLI